MGKQWREQGCYTYVKQRDNQAIIFLNVINKDDRLKHIAVDEDYDTVAAMLNS